MHRLATILSCLSVVVAVVPHSLAAAPVFQDDLDGTPGANLVGTLPDIGGTAWADAPVPAVPGEFHFAAGGGVEDIGFNHPSTNAGATSALLTPFELSSLGANEVLHLRVTMANISATPASNAFVSTRIDLVTDTSGRIFLGELGTNGNWGASSDGGGSASSGISTAQAGLFDLDLFIDPNDVAGDGNRLNALVQVAGGCPFPLAIPNLSPSTVASECRLIRNADDEVFFRNLLLETTALPAMPTLIFHDDLDGATGADLVGTNPDVGGGTWTGAGSTPFGEILFAAGGGVEDAGPNPGFGNAGANSVLLSPFSLAALAPGEVLHLHVAMANIAAVPLNNDFQSTRVDLATDTSGRIFLGELGTGGNWGANSDFGDPINSGITTGQAGVHVLDLFLDPSDAVGDGSFYNAVLQINGGATQVGTITGLSSSTVISEITLFRNVDDEVFFRDLTLERVCGYPRPATEAEPSDIAPVGRISAFPNPFRSQTRLAVTVPQSENAQIEIFDAAGRHVRTLYAGPLNRGVQLLGWDGLDGHGAPTAAGIYYVRTRFASHAQTVRIVRMR